MTEFAGVPDWPEQKLSSGRDAKHDNQPPLEERILLDFQDDLDRASSDGGKSISERVAELLASAQRAPAIDSQAIAGKVGDLIKQTSDVSKRIENVRESHNRPLLNAQRALKAKADGIFAPLANEIAKLRQSLTTFMAEETRKADEARRAAEAEARRLQEEARAKAEPNEPHAPIEPEKVEAPVARGDLGARVGTRTVWKHEIESVRQVPDRLLKHPKVLDALNIVIAAEIRGGCREIKGVKIWSEHEASVR
jgi:hypothetical protein